MLHTCEVKRAHPELTLASKTRSKKRIATAPEKLLMVAKQESTSPHMRMQRHEYLAKGSPCIGLAAGYSHVKTHSSESEF